MSERWYIKMSWEGGDFATIFPVSDKDPRQEAEDNCRQAMAELRVSQAEPAVLDDDYPDAIDQMISDHLEDWQVLECHPSAQTIDF